MENNDIEWKVIQRLNQNKYKLIYNSYDDNIKYVTINNIEIKYYRRKNCNKRDKIILRIIINSC